MNQTSRGSGTVAQLPANGPAAAAAAARNSFSNAVLVGDNSSPTFNGSLTSMNPFGEVSYIDTEFLFFPSSSTDETLKKENNKHTRIYKRTRVRAAHLNLKFSYNLVFPRPNETAAPLMPPPSQQSSSSSGSSIPPSVFTNEFISRNDRLMLLMNEAVHNILMLESGICFSDAFKKRLTYNEGLASLSAASFSAAPGGLSPPPQPSGARVLIDENLATDESDHLFCAVYFAAVLQPIGCHEPIRPDLGTLQQWYKTMVLMVCLASVGSHAAACAAAHEILERHSGGGGGLFAGDAPPSALAVQSAIAVLGRLPSTPLPPPNRREVSGNALRNLVVLPDCIANARRDCRYLLGELSAPPPTVDDGSPWPVRRRGVQSGLDYWHPLHGAHASSSFSAPSSSAAAAAAGSAGSGGPSATTPTAGNNNRGAVGGASAALASVLFGHKRERDATAPAQHCPQCATLEAEVCSWKASYVNARSVGAAEAAHLKSQLKTATEELKQLRQQRTAAAAAAAAAALPPPPPPAMPSSQGDGGDSTPTCAICLCNPVQQAITPCGHACLCLTCAKKVSDCPICRKKIKSRVRIYL